MIVRGPSNNTEPTARVEKFHPSGEYVGAAPYISR